MLRAGASLPEVGRCCATPAASDRDLREGRREALQAIARPGRERSYERAARILNDTARCVERSGYKLDGARRGCYASSSTLDAAGARRSRSSARSRGRRSGRADSLARDAAGSGARVRALPARESTRGSRCHRPICCPTGQRRAVPYLYTDEQITALMAPPSTLRTRTCGDVPDADRPAGGHRDAYRGGDRA